MSLTGWMSHTTEEVMKRTAYSLSLVCMSYLLMSVQSAVYAQSKYVRSVTECGHAVYDKDTLVVENSCDITVSITWTSSGNVWGTALNIGPGGHQSTGSSRDDVNEAGGVETFTCPGDSTPVTGEGKPIGTHYKGRYACQRP